MIKDNARKSQQQSKKKGNRPPTATRKMKSPKMNNNNNDISSGGAQNIGNHEYGEDYEQERTIEFFDLEGSSSNLEVLE